MRSVITDRLVAVLGPTNTGKTHYAIERMCAHSSGLMAFPLRLLAREVYDRVVAIKGAAQVALLTGEEKILPPHARYYLCTTESMPTDRDFAFVALDEAQLAADPERGHVFTDRLLRARGREETLILGAVARKATTFRTIWRVDGPSAAFRTRLISNCSICAASHASVSAGLARICTGRRGSSATTRCTSGSNATGARAGWGRRARRA